MKAEGTSRFVHLTGHLTSTGTIRVNDDLDFETTSSYTLKVRAMDVITGDWSDAIVQLRILVSFQP